jgi:hypothetical protein
MSQPLLFDKVDELLTVKDVVGALIKAGAAAAPLFAQFLQALVITFI